MKKPVVFVSRSIAPLALERLRLNCEVNTWPKPEPPPYEIVFNEAVRSDGILTLLTDQIDENMIKASSPKLKIISQMAVGFDNINVRTATELKIPVGHTPGVLTETTADMAWGLLMSAARRIAEADSEVRNGTWRPWGPDVLTGEDIYGSTLGIIGFGRIGQAVARRARGFSMRILYFDLQRNEKAEFETGAIYSSLEQLLSESDYVSIHVLLSPETRHLIGESQLKLMKPSAILINTARGPIVDSDALYHALLNGTIASAGLDVFDPEPIPADHPLIKLRNLIVTPHIASASKKTRILMANMAVDNLLAGLNGDRLPHCANPEVYE